MSNSQQSCYLRFRGRVSGPFPFSRIKEMAGSGLVSPIHEISADRTAWKSAGDIPELFPTPTDVELLPAAVPAAAPEKWHYADANGQQNGPIGRDELLRLFDAGVIGNATGVWKAGMERWVPLAETGMVPAQPRSRAREEPARRREPEEPSRQAGRDDEPLVLRPGIGKGITSMVLGILSVVFTCTSFMPYLFITLGSVQLVLGILAIVFGAIGMKTKGRGFAITGLVCGIVGVSLILLMFILILSFAGMVAFERTRWAY